VVFFSLFLLLSILLTLLYISFIFYFSHGLSQVLKIRGAKERAFSVPVTVIIPVRNEAFNIIRCLEDLEKQDYPADLCEVIVTDDFSDDHTCRLVEAYISKHPEQRVSLLTPSSEGKNKTGKKMAISRAVESAGGQLILTTDADTIHNRCWISSFVRMSETHRPKMILGPVAFHREETMLQKIQSLEFMGIMAVTAGSVWHGMPLMCNGASLAFTKEAFLRVEGYEGNMEYASGDDMFLMAKIRRQYKGGSIRFLDNHEAVTFTVAEKSWNGFINQRIRWISKSRGYTEPWIKFISVLTWSLHFLLLTGMILGLADLRFLYYSFGLWMIKILSDFIPVSMMARFLQKEYLTGYYFIAQVFQLFYVSVFGVIGNLLPYRWKGRAYRK